MDGNRIRKKMTGGSDAASVLYPINGVREATKRRGGKPKDHAKENVLNMRRKAEQRKKVEEEKQASKQKSLFKMKKFERVGSRVNVAEVSFIGWLYRRQLSAFVVGGFQYPKT